MTFSLVGTLIDLLTNVLSTVGLPGLLALMVVAGFGVPPLPSEVILPFAGFLVVEQKFSFEGALAAALVGTLVGSYLAYILGRWWRDRITGVGFGALRIDASHLKRMDDFFARRGELAVALARLVPVVRPYISYPAGTARMPPVRFGVYTLAGSIPFTVGFLYAGMLLRSDWRTISADLGYFDAVAIGLIVLAVVYLVLLVAGVLAPGWPPRRPARAPPTAATGPKPGSPGS